MAWSLAQKVLMVVALCGISNLTMTSGLTCFKCIAFDCPNEPSICKSMESFVYRHIHQFYFIEDELPLCPPPDDRNPGWERLKTASPTSYPCQGDIMRNEPTCILGRFQVQTQTTENNRNFTSHGSIMGCAKPDLLTRIKISLEQTSGIGPQNANSGGRPTLYRDESDDVSIVTQKPCHTDRLQSRIENSLQHFMEIEHCSISSDICYNHDFCVMPRESVVKPFVDSKYDSEGLGTVTTVFIWTFIVLAVIIVILTFLGIKYNT